MTEALIHFIITFGYVALFLAVFLESGVFFGFFLPGDSLLFTAGLLAGSGHFNLALVCLICFIAATLGVQFGYWFGARFGKKLFERDTFFFRKEHIEQAHQFYLERGKSTIVLARFIPIVRTFAPIVAGIANMPYKDFVTYNIVGAIIWAIGIPVLGYYMGELIPDVDKYLLPIVIIIAVASIIPAIVHMIQNKKKSSHR